MIRDAFLTFVLVSGVLVVGVLIIGFWDYMKGGK